MKSRALFQLATNGDIMGIFHQQYGNNLKEHEEISSILLVNVDDISPYNIWLVVQNPSWKIWVNGKDDIPYMMETNPNVWNHQPDNLNIINNYEDIMEISSGNTYTVYIYICIWRCLYIVMGVASCIQVMDDHETILVVKPMVTWGSHILRNHHDWRLAIPQITG